MTDYERGFMAKLAGYRGPLLKRADPVTESMFLPVGATPTSREREVAKMLVDRFNQHIAHPEMSPPGTLTRSTIDVGKLSGKDLERAGFLPSYIAVPEKGQSMLRTYRHPMNGMHFHLHDDKWLFHEDTYASLQMLIKRYKMQHPNASTRDVIRYTFKKALPNSMGHIVHEGTPGYMQYLDNIIQGKPGFFGGKNPTFLRRAKGAGGAMGVMMTANRLATGEWQPVTAAGTVGGFLGSHAIADRIGRIAKLKVPGWRNTLVRAGIPIVGTIASTIGGNRLQKKLNNYKSFSNVDISRAFSSGRPR